MSLLPFISRLAPAPAARPLRLALPFWLAALTALVLAASPVAAQTSGASPGIMPSAAVITDDDRDVVLDLAHAHLAEIDGARLALEKSQNEDVRRFAQRMIDEHQAAHTELQQLAQAKSIKLPQEANLIHKTLATAMRLLSGETFDHQYISRMGINDNQRTVEMLQKALVEAKDADIRAHAVRVLPVIQEHLATARQLNGQKLG